MHNIQQFLVSEGEVGVVFRSQQLYLHRLRSGVLLLRRDEARLTRTVKTRLVFILT
jgi:hypothetical protein